MNLLRLLTALAAILLFLPQCATAQESAPVDTPSAQAESPDSDAAVGEEDEESASKSHPLVLLAGLVLEFGASLVITAFAFKVMDASGTWSGFLIIAAVNALVVFLVRTGLLLSTGMDATFYVDQALAFFITIPVIKKCTYVHDWVDAVKLAFAIRLGTFLAGILVSFLLLMLAAAMMN